MQIFVPLLMILTSYSTTASYILKFPASFTFVLTCGRNSMFRFFHFELLVGVCITFVTLMASGCLQRLIKCCHQWWMY